MRSVVSRALLSGALALAGCGEDAGLAIAEIFTVDVPSPSAPPGRGPDDRLVVVARSAPAQVSTFDLGTGAPVDAPFDAFPTEEAPIALGRRIALVTPVGRVAIFELNGERVALAPEMALGRTSALVPAPSDTLRVASTTGRLVALDAEGATRFEATLDGAAVGAPAVASDGAAFVTTDLGRLEGFSAAGAPLFGADLSPPASAPALTRSGIVVVADATGVRGFEQGGAEVFSAPATGLSGVIATSDGGALAWSTSGELLRLDASGAPLHSTTVGPASFAPVALPEGRVGWVGDDAVARTLSPSGEVLAERALPAPPTGAALAGDRALLYVPLAAQIIGLDFAFSL